MSWRSWKGDKIVSLYENECRDAIREAVEATGSFIDSNTVPHDEGTLQGSKYIEDDPSEVAVWIGYGGGGITGHPIVPYAKKWHEVPANFQKGRSHNYLRNPMNNQYLQNLRKAVRTKGLTLT